MMSDKALEQSVTGYSERADRGARSAERGRWMSVADMPLVQRLAYALFFLIAASMMVVLGLTVGEGFHLVRGIEIEDSALHPLFFVPVNLIGFVAAPTLNKRLPIGRSWR